VQKLVYQSHSDDDGWLHKKNVCSSYSKLCLIETQSGREKYLMTVQSNLLSHNKRSLYEFFIIVSICVYVLFIEIMMVTLSGTQCVIIINMLLSYYTVYV